MRTWQNILTIINICGTFVISTMVDMTRRNLVDLYYAKAYMRERLEEAQARRLLAEGKGARSDDHMPRRLGHSLESLLRAGATTRSRAAEVCSLEPACCPV